MHLHPVLRAVRRAFRARGADPYYGEPVTQLEHALQVAHLSRTHSHDPAFRVAALLHDVGHLTAPADGEWGTVRHDRTGARWLAGHVDAKRYLCAADTEYAATLSEASTATLALQGGPMDPSERAAFEANPDFEDILALRRLDELGKVPERVVPPLEAYDADILPVLLPPPDPERAEDDVPRWAAEPTWTYVPVGARQLVQPKPAY